MTIQLLCSTCFRSLSILFDFRNASDLNGWTEQSDTVRSAGRSKATFDLYKTRTDQSAILFTLLNPLPNGACFGGVRKATQWNLDGYQNILFSCKTTGNATTYKIVLRHDNMNDEPHPTFEQKFEVRAPVRRYVAAGSGCWSFGYPGTLITARLGADKFKAHDYTCLGTKN